MPGPPKKSQGIFHDLYHFLVRRPPTRTLMEVADDTAREDFEERIRHRLGISVEEYGVLNIHRIGVDAPLRLVFEELLTWHEASVWWPNHLAKAHRVDGSLEHVKVMLLGSPIELFRLRAVRIRRDPGPEDLDNARYVLYETSGGYPIGVFGMYVRSRIADRGEVEPTQVFFAVSFNFYGKRKWPHRRLLNPVWEWVHDRATGNILHRFKQLCEAAFRQLSG